MARKVSSVALLPYIGSQHLERALRVVSRFDGPKLAVVLEAEQAWWAPQLERTPAEILAQPFHRGSGVGLLLAVLHIFRKDPLARMVVLRSDEPTHLEAAEAALEQIEGDAILKIKPQGGLPSTLVASAGAFLHLYHRAQPELLRAFLELRGNHFDRLYPWLPEVDLDRDILQNVVQLSHQLQACGA